MITVTFDLPMPPSTNNLYRNVSAKERAAWQGRGRGKLRGRRKTDAYEKWLSLATSEMMAQRSGRGDQPFLVPVKVTVRLREAAFGDVDNRLKSLLDVCTLMSVWDDDKLVHEIDLRRDPLEGVHKRYDCRIIIEPIGAA